MCYLYCVEKYNLTLPIINPIIIPIIMIYIKLTYQYMDTLSIDIRKMCF